MSTSARKTGYHHGDLRNALIEAGLQLIEKNEFSKIGLREAARTAKVSPGAPYRHFASREALLAAIAARGFEALTAASEAVKQEHPGSPLNRLGHVYLDFALANRNLFRLMFSGELRKQDHPELMEAAQRSIQSLQAAMRSTGTPHTREASVGAWALVHGLAHLLVDQQLSPDMMEGAARDRLIDTVTAIYGKGLRAT